MRFAIVISVWIVFLGGLALYMNQRGEAPEARTFEQAEADGVFALEITPSFDAEPDPFALNVDDSTDSAALQVRLAGDEVFRGGDSVIAGRPILVRPIEGLTLGKNEFYLEASPPMDDGGRSHAVRVRVFRDDRVFFERTFWSEPGGRVAATFVADLEAETVEGNERDGDH